MERSAAESFAPKLLMVAGSILLLAAVWAVFAGLRLGGAEKKAHIEEGRLKRVQEFMGDAAFRAQLAAAVKTLSEDSQAMPIKLSGLCEKMHVKYDGVITPHDIPMANQGQRQIEADMTFKDLSLSRVLDYACQVELQIPGALVAELTLKPIQGRGDLWEAHFKVAKRVKLAP